MKLSVIIGTAVLSLSLGVAAPAFAQEQHEQEERKSNPAAQEEKKAQPEKSAKHEEKPSPQREKNSRPNTTKQVKSPKPAQQNAQQPQRAGNNSGGRISDARFKANFGRQHTFRVSQGDYNNHRFQYGGYWFGFAEPWPSNWLYTQDVYVVDINGVYYLCNTNYPGVNLTLSFTL